MRRMACFGAVIGVAMALGVFAYIWVLVIERGATLADYGKTGVSEKESRCTMP